MKTIRHKLYVSTFLTDTSIIAILFAVSRRLAEQGAEPMTLGIIGGGVSLLWGCGSLSGGILSDRIGRRPVILAGIALMLLSSLGCICFHSRMTALTPFYWLSGLAGGAFYAPLIAWLGEGESGVAAGRQRVKRTLMFFCFAWNLGIVCGQFFGGVLFAVDPRGPLWLAAGLTLVNIIVVGGIREQREVDRPGPEQAPAIPERERALSAAFARMCWIASFGGTACIGVLFHIFPSLAVELNISSRLHGTLLAIMRFAVIASYVFMQRASFWHHSFSSAMVTRVAALIGMLVLCLAVTPLGLLAGMLGLGFAQGFNYFASVYYSTTGSRQDNRGRTTGKMEAMISMGMGIGTLLGGAVGIFSLRVPYALGLGIVLVLVFVELAIYVRHIRPLMRSL